MSDPTLGIGGDLLKSARLYAVAQDTSMNTTVHECLRGIVGRATEDAVITYPAGSAEERQAALLGIEEIASRIHREQRIKTDWKWHRDDLHEDRLDR